jgi:uncharacterized protein YrrD
MRRIREIIGLPVLNIKTEVQIGHVNDVIFDDKESKIIGIILDKDALLTKNFAGLTRGNLVEIGKEAIIADCSNYEGLCGTAWSEKEGGKVYNFDGTIKGCIVDVFVDETMQEILGYEISDGLFADLLNGREAILEENILVEGKDVIVIEGG